MKTNMFKRSMISNLATKMGVTIDALLNGFNRCYSRCQNRMGVKTTYTGQEDYETLVEDGK